MIASTSQLPTPPHSLRLARSTGSLVPELSPHVGDSSGEQSIDTPSPPQLTRSRTGKSVVESPSSALRLRTRSTDHATLSQAQRLSMPRTSRDESVWTPHAPSYHKRRRIRVNSATTTSSLRSIPIGFPYRRAAPLLDADTAWSSAGGSEGMRDDDSSEDVDLDLTLEWEQRRAHIGIDMTDETVTQAGATGLAAPAVIRSSQSWERGAEIDYGGAGWPFLPSGLPLEIDTERANAAPEEGRNRQHSWHGMLLNAVKSPSWSMSGASSSDPSRRGSRVESSWGRTTTAATTPQSPFFSPHMPAKAPDSSTEHDRGPAIPEMNVNAAESRVTGSSGSLPFRLIRAFRDSLPAVLPTSTEQRSPQTSASAPNEGLGISFNTPPASPVPDVSVSAPDGRTEAHIRWATSPAKSPRTFRPKQLLLASRAKLASSGTEPTAAYRPMRLNQSQGSYLPPSPQSPLISPRPGSPSSTPSSRSASPSPSHVCHRREPLPWYDERSPAEWLFLAGFVCGPWLWLIGAFCLRAVDGEYFGSRGIVCRCRRDQCWCHSAQRRELRLAGVRDSGMGIFVDALAAPKRHQVAVDGPVDGWIKANRMAAAISGILIVTLVAVALQSVVRAW